MSQCSNFFQWISTYIVINIKSCLNYIQLKLNTHLQTLYLSKSHIISHQSVFEIYANKIQIFTSILKSLNTLRKIFNYSFHKPIHLAFTLIQNIKKNPIKKSFHFKEFIENSWLSFKLGCTGKINNLAYYTCISEAFFRTLFI